jgi:hypothetical protein
MTEPQNKPQGDDLVLLPVARPLRGVLLGTPVTLPPGTIGPEKAVAFHFYDREAERLRILAGGLGWLRELLALKRRGEVGRLEVVIHCLGADEAAGYRIDVEREIDMDEAARLAALPRFVLLPATA